MNAGDSFIQDAATKDYTRRLKGGRDPITELVLVDRDIFAAAPRAGEPPCSKVSSIAHCWPCLGTVKHLLEYFCFTTLMSSTVFVWVTVSCQSTKTSCFSLGIIRLGAYSSYVSFPTTCCVCCSHTEYCGPRLCRNQARKILSGPSTCLWSQRQPSKLRLSHPCNSAKMRSIWFDCRVPQPFPRAEKASIHPLFNSVHDKLNLS